MYQEQKIIKDNLAAFNRTRYHYNKPKCRLMQEQLASQDDTIILLKNEINSQAHTLESMNRLVSRKHDTITNMHDQLRYILINFLLLEILLYKINLPMY